MGSALCLWLPWKHISVCCRRCRRDFFHFVPMLRCVQESINKKQVGGTWLCLRTGSSSSCCRSVFSFILTVKAVRAECVVAPQPISTEQKYCRGSAPFNRIPGICINVCSVRFSAQICWFFRFSFPFYLVTTLCLWSGWFGSRQNLVLF